MLSEYHSFHNREVHEIKVNVIDVDQQAKIKLSRKEALKENATEDKG